MAIYKSELITALDTSPPRFPATDEGSQFVKAQHSVVTKGAGHSTNDQYRMLRVWSGWRLKRLWFECAAWGTSGSIDIGAYYAPTEFDSTGAVIDADRFATDVNVASAVALTDLLTEALTVAARKQRVWEACGLSSDPLRWIDIVIDANNIGAAQAAETFMEVEYTD